MNFEFDSLSLALVVAVLLVVAGLAVFFLTRKKSPEELPSVPRETKPETPAPPPVSAPTPAPPSGKVLAGKLAKSRGSFWSLFPGWKAETRSQALESLEEALLGSDVGIKTTQKLLENVKTQNASERTEADFLRDLKGVCFDILDAPLKKAEENFRTKPWVVAIVGVNGVGKTTTIGKLAQKYSEEGKKVLLGAADTFRAAATEQLRVWSERTGAQFVFGREGSDPGAVAFDAVSASVARGVDVTLIDTAGRLHTKQNLMDELKKVVKVIQKVIPEAPHEIWLVLDGMFGQNAVRQAQEFKEALPLTGVIVTKLDGSAKGGAVLSIASDLGLPVRYIGVGEKAEDLMPFSPRDFVDALFDR